MKKILVAMLILFTMFALAACGSDDGTQDTMEAQESPTQPSTQNEVPLTDAITQTPAPEYTAEPEQAHEILSTMEIPDYILIQGAQLSTALTEFETLRRDWHLTDEEIASLRYMINLTSLDLNLTNISDLTPLVGLPNLTNLTLIAGSTHPDLNFMTVLADSTSLTYLHLNLWGVEVADIDFTPLTRLSNLTYLGLIMSGGGNPITDLSPLVNLTNLTFLSLPHNQISDLTPLAGLTNLTHLDFHFNQITDITPLAHLTNLTFLNLTSNPVTDITPLSGLIHLTDLYFSNNPIADITPLAGLVSLTNLWMTNSQIYDITPLAGLIHLTDLWMTDNQIHDITPLAGLTNLRSVWLDGNPFTDWSPLDHIHPRVPSPTIASPPDNPHPFAEVLSHFFVNLSTPPYFHQHEPSYHAILVDLDGSGTQGMIASKWSSDRQRYHPYSPMFGPVFVQKLFYMYDNQLHEINGGWNVTSERRLVTITGANGQGMSTKAYTLYDFVDGDVIPIKSISVTEYLRLDWYGFQPDHDGNSYLLSYHTGVDFWNRDWEQDQPLTHEAFNEIMTRYGLQDAADLWEWPDETHAIMQMTANQPRH